MNAKHTQKVTVLGEGAWGSALAMLFARNGYAVSLWCHHQDVAQQIQQEQKNDRFFPHHVFSPLITATTSAKEAMHDPTIVVEAIPVAFIRSVIEKVRPFCHANQIWVVTSKGVEQDTLKLPAHIIASMLGDDLCRAVVMGPSFAAELAANKMTAFDIGITDPALYDQVAHLFTNSQVVCYKDGDIIGMQLCGAMKNLIALGVGILKGAGIGENGSALFISRMILEIRDLIVACGGSIDSLFRVSGIGDIILTSLGSCSRNLYCGKLLGEGVLVQEMHLKMATLPEGIYTARSIHALANQKGVAMPLSCAIASIVEGSGGIQFLIDSLKDDRLAF